MVGEEEGTCVWRLEKGLRAGKKLGARKQGSQPDHGEGGAIGRWSCICW